MRHIVKYLLVIAVLAAGYHAASQFKTAGPQTTDHRDARSTNESLPLDPDAAPHAAAPIAQARLAALIDTEQQTASSTEFDWPTVRTKPSLNRPPSIEKSEMAGKAGEVEKAAPSREADWKGPSKKKPSARDKRHSAKNPTTGKESQQRKTPIGTKNRRVADNTRKKPKASKPDHSHTDGGATNTTAIRRADVASGSVRGFTYADRSSSISATQLDDDWPSSERSTGHGGSNGSVSSTLEDVFRPKDDNAAANTTNEPHRHRIVANDTLPKLAQTYLGDRSRYLDIFRANPDVLSDPRLLPIGVEITIPDLQARNVLGRDSGVEGQRAPDAPTEEGDMIPVPSYALPPRESDYGSPIRTGNLPRSRFGI